MRVSRRHPDYNESTQRYDYLVRAYLGGEYVRAGEYLDKYPREALDVFRARVQRAYWTNYTAAVVNSYVSEVFRVAPAREVSGDAAEEFVADATGAGQTLTEVMRGALTRALAGGVAYMSVDLDADNAPYVHDIHPDNLLDYSEARDGLNWALVAESERVDSDPDADAQTLRRYRLWTREEVRVYDHNGDIIRRMPNSAGVVPLVSLRGSDSKLPVADIVDANRRIYNLSSQLDEILIRVTFPQFYIQDVIDEETDTEQRAIEIGTGKVLALPPGTSTPPGFVAPPDGPAKLQMEERERLVKMIYSLAGLQRHDPDGIRAQSGVAKSYDFKETNARLSGAAAATERAELQIFDLLRRYGKLAGTALGGEPNVTYKKDFEMQPFSERLEEYLKLTDATLPATAKRMAAADLVGALTEERTPEERREAREAVEQMPDADFESAGQSFNRNVGNSALPDLGQRLGESLSDG